MECVGESGGRGVTVHSFAESLARSSAEADNPIWGEIYRKAFHNFDSMTCVRADGWAQRGGIDRVLTLKSGKTLSVDEKVRAKDYGDVLLEYWSDERGRVPGWVAKDLACDFVAYAVLPARTCYLLPFQLLRRAWRANGADWVKRHRRILAENIGYTTVSVGVPVVELFAALNDSMSITWGEI